MFDASPLILLGKLSHLELLAALSESIAIHLEIDGDSPAGASMAGETTRTELTFPASEFQRFLVGR